MSLKTKILILAVLGILFTLVIITPNVLPNRTTNSQYICMNNLRLIDGAKQQWALANEKTNGAVAWNDILPYLGKEPKVQIPRCPKGGTYILGNIGEPPKCSIGGNHSL